MSKLLVTIQKYRWPTRCTDRRAAAWAILVLVIPQRDDRADGHTASEGADGVHELPDPPAPVASTSATATNGYGNSEAVGFAAPHAVYDDWGALYNPEQFAGPCAHRVPTCTDEWVPALPTAPSTVWAGSTLRSSPSTQLRPLRRQQAVGHLRRPRQSGLWTSDTPFIFPFLSNGTPDIPPIIPGRARRLRCVQWHPCCVVLTSACSQAVWSAGTTRAC